MDVNDYIKLLRANKNLILTGAPGTGKTFLARLIAASMVSNRIITDLKCLTPEEKEKVKKANLVCSISSFL